MVRKRRMAIDVDLASVNERHAHAIGRRDIVDHWLACSYLAASSSSTIASPMPRPTFM